MSGAARAATLASHWRSSVVTIMNPAGGVIGERTARVTDRHNDGHRNLGRILDAIAREAVSGRVSVRDVLRVLGPRAFTPMLLVPCLVLVSPVSTIPGVPTVLSCLSGLVAVQMLFGQNRIWLPHALLDRSIDAARLRRAIAFMRRPVSMIDPWIRERLTVLADKPGNLPALCLFCVVSFLMPVIEFVPLLTTVLATAMSFLAIGLFARDGVLMLAGYMLVAAGTVLVRHAALAVT